MLFSINVVVPVALIFYRTGRKELQLQDVKRILDSISDELGKAGIMIDDTRDDYTSISTTYSDVFPNFSIYNSSTISCPDYSLLIRRKPYIEGDVPDDLLFVLKRLIREQLGKRPTCFSKPRG